MSEVHTPPNGPTSPTGNPGSATENVRLPGPNGSVADPGGGPEAQAPPAPVKTSQKKMATTTGCKFDESSGPPSGKFLGPLL